MIIDRPAPPRAAAPGTSDDQGNGLHLLFDLGDPHEPLAQVKAAPTVETGAQKRPGYRKTHRVFWDTTDLRLGRAGLALSVETRAQTRQQRILDMRKPPTGGRVRRDIAVSLGEEGLDLTRLAFLGGIDPTLVNRVDGRAMVPVFAVNSHHTLWSIFWGETRLTLCLKTSTIDSTAGSHAVTQLDLHHLDGPAQGLYDFARHLARDIPLVLATRDPVQGAYQALGVTQWWDPQTLMQPNLACTMTLRQGITEVGRALSAQLRFSIADLQNGLDPDRIHKTRIALRQLRSLLSVFRAVLPPTHRRLIAEELGGLANRLGLTREWDVFLKDTLEPLIRAVGEEASLRSLRLSSAVLREASATEARAALGNGAFLALSLKLGAWFDADLWPETPDAETSARLDGNFSDYARDLLRHRHRKLLQTGTHLVDPTPGDLHALRIEAKKLRYSAEFLRPIFSMKQSKPFLAHLRAVQEILGTLNDAAAARSLIPRLTKADPNGGMRAGGIVVGWTAAAQESARAHFKTTWRVFAETKKFW